jgi:hypothetical protein
MDIADLDRVERLRIAYSMLCDSVYNKSRPKASEIKNTNMESSPPVNLSRLTYKNYIDKRLDRFIEAICETVEKWG